jgi:hypothetical protein
MPCKWDRYKDKADKQESAEYMVGHCHDVTGVKETTVLDLYVTLVLKYGGPRDIP